MSNPLNGPRYLSRTIETILQMKRDKSHSNISVKNIRLVKGIDGSDRSAVNFYSYALTFLVREGVLKTINNGSPKKYVLIDENKLKSLALD